MTIEQLILSAKQHKDYNAASYFKYIVSVAQNNNITINESICYLLNTNKNKYHQNLLHLAQKFFPPINNKYNKQSYEQDVNCCKINVQPKEQIRLHITRN